MKARLTLVYEKEVSEDSREYLAEIAKERDEQALFEAFDMGWENPTTTKVEFVES